MSCRLNSNSIYTIKNLWIFFPRKHVEVHFTVSQKTMSKFVTINNENNFHACSLYVSTSEMYDKLFAANFSVLTYKEL